MILDVWYDSYKITDYCMVTRISPYVAPKNEGLQVIINIVIKNDIQYNLDRLNEILFTREPKPLIISNTQDRYLLCELDGGIELSSRFSAGEATLTFKSEDSYWYSTIGTKVTNANNQGVITVNNQGTAPAVPLFEISFPSDAGFFGIVAPNGYLALGDKEQQDSIELPSQQLAMNEEMHQSDMSDWTRLTSNSHSNGLWVPDYNKLDLTSSNPTFDEWGIKLLKPTSPKLDQWNSWGYVKNLATIQEEIHQLTNFKLQSRITFEDKSGKKNNTGMFLIVLMDAENKPIMTTSIFNILNNSNEVTVTAKINDFSGKANNKSKIIHTARFVNGFDGAIQMIKEGDNFQWIWDSGKNQESTITSPVIEKFGENDIVYIKTSARYGYDHNGKSYNIAGFTRGRPNIVQSIRTWNGVKQCLITYQGTQLYWMNETDLTANKSGVGQTGKEIKWADEKVVKFNTRNSQLATLKPEKVLVVGGTWSNTTGFSRTSINSVRVTRLNAGDKFTKVANTFAKDDRLTINNSTGEIIHNGTTFNGLFDYDSRFFDIDYGPSELQILTSEWAQQPKVEMHFIERFR